MFRILRKLPLNQTVTWMEIEAPKIAVKAKTGQFVMLRVDQFGERIPLTIADINLNTGSITIIFQVAGQTTQLLNTLNQGDTIMDVVGPLGEPTHYPEKIDKICVVGGGVGCAIAYPQAKTLFKMGAKVDVITGFRNHDLVILEEAFKQVSDRLFICTDDGSYGEKALVTEVLKRLIESGNHYDLVIAIGPIPMMKFVAKTTKPYQIKTIVSLNPLMIDGTGMCGCCRVTVNQETKFACIDGPDFDGHQVDFDDLIHRNRSYRFEEKLAFEKPLRKVGGVKNA